MDNYFIYYAVSNFFGIVVFGIMLGHDLANVDRQEKQVKYDRALCAFMLYFLNDAFWASIDDGYLAASRLTTMATNYANCLFMTAITYFWLQFVLAVEQAPGRNKTINRIWIGLPFVLASIALLVIMIVSPLSVVDSDVNTTTLYKVFLIAVPCMYIFAIVIYAMKKVSHEESLYNRKTHFYVGLFPVFVVVGGMTQMIFMPRIPMFCYCSTILMLIFYIQSINDRISTDPLTQLNNRGQLARYVAQNANLRLEGKATYVVMIDVNDFKLVNDTYGHAEGDAALTIIAKSLVSAVRKHGIQVFLGRYGGDEFVMIAYPSKKEDLESFLSDVREIIYSECADTNKPYDLSIGIGYDELLGEGDSFDKCLQRADSKLYLDKEYCKLNGKSTICH
jgi:diguanylate cyclase (GGDEF)-like protein